MLPCRVCMRSGSFLAADEQRLRRNVDGQQQDTNSGLQSFGQVGAGQSIASEDVSDDSSLVPHQVQSVQASRVRQPSLFSVRSGVDPSSSSQRADHQPCGRPRVDRTRILICADFEFEVDS